MDVLMVRYNNLTYYLNCELLQCFATVFGITAITGT